MHGWVKISPLENTPISPNRIGRNFGNLLVFVNSFMDNYRGFRGPSSNLKRGVPWSLASTLAPWESSFATLLASPEANTSALSLELFALISLFLTASTQGKTPKRGSWCELPIVFLRVLCVSYSAEHAWANWLIRTTHVPMWGRIGGRQIEKWQGAERKGTVECWV